MEKGERGEEGNARETKRRLEIELRKIMEARREYR